MAWGWFWETSRGLGRRQPPAVGVSIYCGAAVPSEGQKSTQSGFSRCMELDAFWLSQFAMPNEYFPVHPLARIGTT